MCEKTDFDAKTAEFDGRLLEFFEDWRGFVQQHRSKARLKSTDWLEDFCSYVRESLVCFEKLGRLNCLFPLCFDDFYSPTSADIAAK